MRIGIFFTPSKSHGGAFQYSVTIVESLLKIPNNEYIIFSLSHDFPKQLLKRRGVRLINVGRKSSRLYFYFRDIVSKVFALIPFNIFSFVYNSGVFPVVGLFHKLSQRKTISLLKSNNLDIVFYPSLDYLSFLVDIPSVVTVYDLGHRNTPKLKEAMVGGRWEYREYGLVNVCKKAFRIFVDSDILKKRLINYYHVDTGKIVTLPYLTPSYLRQGINRNEEKKILRKLKLRPPYVFYPAKFWPHKNHIHLVKAIKILIDKGIDLRLVLTGSKEADYSTFNSIMDFVHKNKLDNYVDYFGYVDNDELSVIYKNALAMAMPTFLGPTNIPVLEAWQMGTPVIYSDINGCRQQLGDAGLLINPRKPKDIAAKILKVYTSEKLRQGLVKKGNTRLNLWGIGDFEKTITNLVKDFEQSKKWSKK